MGTRERIGKAVQEAVSSANARAAWGNFPPVNILAELGDLRKHPRYGEAKGGNVNAAYQIIKSIEDRAGGKWIDSIRAMLGDSRPVLVPVHAREQSDLPLGNAIPGTLAVILGQALGLRVDTRVVQISIVKRTGADGWTRLALPPGFAGKLDTPSLGALMVDDTLTQGGTLANQRGWLEAQGAHVIGAVTLTGKQYFATLRIQTSTLKDLRGLYATIEDWWIALRGYGFDRFTESEARYLIKSGKTADEVRNIIIARRQEAGLR